MRRSGWLMPLAVLALGGLAIAGVWGGFILETRQDRLRAMAAAETRLVGVADALTEQVERSLSGINVASLYLRHAWATNREHFAEVVETLRPVNALSAEWNVMVNDRDGWMVFSTYPPTADRVNFSERDHFRVHVEQGGDDLFISKPILGKLSHRQMIPCSRRMVDEHGRFAGIAVVAVAPEDLVRLEDHLNLGTRGGATLVGLDGVVRASVSRSPGTVAPIGYTVTTDRPYLRDQQGVFVADSIIDGEPRMFAFRQLRQFPLSMVVSEPVADILDTMQPHQRELGLYASAATALIAGFALVLAHFLRTLDSRNRALEATRRRADLILSSAGEGICGFDAGGAVTFINPTARDMLGWDESDSGTRALLTEQLRQMLHSGESKSTLCRADGVWFPIELTATSIVDQDRTAGDVLVFRDVTRAVSIEQALIDQSNALTRTNAELEQFAYVASHDLREPLRMVSSFLTLLEKRLSGTLDKDCAEFLGFARDGAQRMDRLVLDLLEYSRIGRLQRPMEAVNLGDVLSDVQRNLSAALAETHGTITVAGSLPTVVGDAQELTRLLQNLVGNALKYHAPDRAPVVEVSARPDGANWRIAVKDNGIGIPPEHFTRVFGVFQRLHNREQYEGTGIGLAICKKVVEHHGGRIWVESAPDAGSTFLFTLPA